MREIEIKARVSNKMALLALLKDNGVEVSKPVTHHDRVFGIPGAEGDDNNASPWLRIRTETKDGKKAASLYA